MVCSPSSATLWHDIRFARVRDSELSERTLGLLGGVPAGLASSGVVVGVLRGMKTPSIPTPTEIALAPNGTAAFFFISTARMISPLSLSWCARTVEYFLTCRRFVITTRKAYITTKTCHRYQRDTASASDLRRIQVGLRESAQIMISDYASIIDHPDNSRSKSSAKAANASKLLLP